MSMGKKAMWLYPKVVGFNPPERWGHSACFYDGVIYIFGGCCGGLHFSDVLTLNLDTMAWSSLTTTGHKPGTRDSHSAAVVGHRMIILGGTNGSKKVNDLHILDLKSKEWSKPSCNGTPPSPRESHTTTSIGDDKLIVFGGSGEGEANYLNDVHVLDMRSMTWTSQEVKGEIPAARDSHSAVAVGNKLVVFGGDCGDRYHGEVDVLDIDTMTWSRLASKGASPGVRAGHAAVSIDSKVYIIGGVGDKQYYSDIWKLDVASCTWTELEVCGQQPQGRFSHTAVVTDTDVIIYGGCGEDERPLNELLVLQLGSAHVNGRYNISMCKLLGNHWNQEKRKFLKSVAADNTALNGGALGPKQSELKNGEQRNSLLRCSDNGVTVKRRKANEGQANEVELDQEEHSLSLSQHSSPSQSDQEQNGIQKLAAPSSNVSASPYQQFVRHKQHKEHPGNAHPMARDLSISCADPRKPNKVLDQVIHPVPQQRHEMPFLTADQRPLPRQPVPSLVGSEVHGTVDGAFDSGLLMTAVVNGQIYRGVLFSPGPGFAAPRSAMLPQILTGSAVIPQHRSALPHAIPVHHARPAPPAASAVEWADFTQMKRRAQPAQMNHKVEKLERLDNDLHDVVLTLGGPGGK